jgi:hypothetical protein
LLNSEKSAETGFTPFEYVFGSTDVSYLQLPTESAKFHSDYLRILNEDLHRIREIAKGIQEAEQQRRKSTHTLNTYVVGDYVLFDETSKGFKDQKLRTRYSGPYVITNVYKADITCRHIVTAKEKVFHMEHLKPFVGSLKEAFEAAKSDDDQYVIRKIIDYRGEPKTRSEMEFLVHFEDNDTVWLKYNQDLASSAPFQDYISTHRELEPLTLNASQWLHMRSRYNKNGIVGVQPGDECYVLLKSWGADYFRSLHLPIGPRYVVQCRYVKWTTSRRFKIDIECRLFDQLFEWNAATVRLYGMYFELMPDMVLVDESFCQSHPSVME